MTRLALATLLLLCACGADSGRYLQPLTDRASSPHARGRSEKLERDDDIPSPLRRPRRPFAEAAEKRLWNDVRVLYVEEHDFPSASIGFIVRRGSAADAPGVATLYARAMVTGPSEEDDAKNHPGQLRWLGAYAHSFVSEDSVTLSTTTLGPLFPYVVPHLCAMATAPTFDDEGLTSARSGARDSAVRMMQDPHAMADVALRSLLFPDEHPYAQLPYATPPARFAQISNQMLEAFRDRYVAGGALTVIAAGDFDPSVMLKQLERCLARIHHTATNPDLSEANSRPAKARLVVVPRRGASQSNIALGFKGARRGDAALSVLGSLLGRGLSGRLDENVRGRHGFTYGVRMHTRLMQHAGLIEIETAVERAHTVDALTAILAEIERLKTEAIDPSELARAKVHAAAEVSRDELDTGGAFGRLHDLATADLPVRYHEELARKIDAVTEEAVQAAADRYLKTGSVQVAIVADAAAFDQARATGSPTLGEALRAFGEVRVE